MALSHEVLDSRKKFDKIRRKSLQDAGDREHIISLCYDVESDDNEGSASSMFVTLLNKEFSAHTAVDVGLAAKWYYDSREFISHFVYFPCFLIEDSVFIFLFFLTTPAPHR